MIPTGTQIADVARLTYIGETEVPGGSRYTNAVLKPSIDSAYRILYTQMMLVDERKARRTSYYNVPAFTGQLTPKAMGISNMGTPKCIWDRMVAQTFTATVQSINDQDDPTPGTPPSIDLSIPNHGLSDGAQVVAFSFSELSEDMNDLWYVHVLDPNTIRLIGCTASPTSDNALGSSGVISTSNEDYPTIPNVNFVTDMQPIRTLASALSTASWVNGAFKFVAANAPRQIKILYTISGNPPTDLADSIGIDNSMEFLACHAAGLAANSLGAPNLAQSLFAMSVGNTSGDPGDGNAGFLGHFFRPQIKASQDQRVILPPFRTRRNTGWWVPF